jgi:hypothetical protein
MLRSVASYGRLERKCAETCAKQSGGAFGPRTGESLGITPLPIETYSMLASFVAGARMDCLLARRVEDKAVGHRPQLKEGTAPTPTPWLGSVHSLACVRAIASTGLRAAVTVSTVHNKPLWCLRRTTASRNRTESNGAHDHTRACTRHARGVAVCGPVSHLFHSSKRHDEFGPTGRPLRAVQSIAPRPVHAPV